MRLIDADHLRRWILSRVLKTQLSVADVIDQIDREDTIEPQRTGRWIPQKGGGLCCSECGGYALDEPDGNFVHVAVPSKFCPHCGARMEENNAKLD